MIIYDDHRFSCNVCQRGHRNMCCDHVHRILYEVRKIGRPKSIRQSKNSGSRLLNGKQQGRNDNDVRLQVELSNGTILVYYGASDLRSIKERLSELGDAKLTVELGKFSKNSAPTQYLARPLKMEVIPSGDKSSITKKDSRWLPGASCPDLATSQGAMPQPASEVYCSPIEAQRRNDIFYSSAPVLSTRSRSPLQRPHIECPVLPYEQRSGYSQKMFYRVLPQQGQSQAQNFSKGEKQLSVYGHQGMYNEVGLYFNTPVFVPEPSHSSSPRQMQSFSKGHFHDFVYNRHGHSLFTPGEEKPEPSYIIPPNAQ